MSRLAKRSLASVVCVALVGQFAEVGTSSAQVTAKECAVAGVTTSNSLICAPNSSSTLVWKPLSVTLPDPCTRFDVPRVLGMVGAKKQIRRTINSPDVRVCGLSDPAYSAVAFTAKKQRAVALSDVEEVALREIDGVLLNTPAGRVFTRSVAPDRVLYWREASPGVIVGLRVTLRPANGQSEQQRKQLISLFLRQHQSDRSIVRTPMEPAPCDEVDVTASNGYLCAPVGDGQPLQWTPLAKPLPDACQLVNAARVAQAAHAKRRMTRGFEEPGRRTCVMTDPDYGAVVFAAVKQDDIVVDIGTHRVSLRESEATQVASKSGQTVNVYATNKDRIVVWREVEPGVVVGVKVIVVAPDALSPADQQVLIDEIGAVAITRR
jgi:hypothetical protein